MDAVVSAYLKLAITVDNSGLGSGPRDLRSWVDGERDEGRHLGVHRLVRAGGDGLRDHVLVDAAAAPDVMS
jgi:hypothetical protein